MAEGSGGVAGLDARPWYAAREAVAFRSLEKRILGLVVLCGGP